jgi:hypothetical protein
LPDAFLPHFCCIWPCVGPKYVTGTYTCRGRRSAPGTKAGQVRWPGATQRASTWRERL